MPFDMAEVAATLRKKLSKENPHLADRIGVGSDLADPKTGPCVEMPDWWKEATNTKGIYFGRTTMFAGPSDSGKTSAAIIAMKAAQEQGCGVLYVETENKTTTKDLASWGVDPNKIFLIKAQIAEEAFEAMFRAIDALMGQDPDGKLLVVFDSIGNTVGLRDSEIDLMTESSQPGSKGKINRLGINKMIIKQDTGKVAFLVINYTYDLMGGHGKTNAGGQAINFFSSMSYQTTRVKWLERTVDKRVVRYGAIVKFQLYKNHIDKADPGLKEFFLRITADGIELAENPNKDKK